LTLHVVWTESARSDLRQIIRYIAESNPTAARRLKELIESGPQTAALAPFLFRQGRLADTREIVVHPNYLVVYKVTDCIEVLSVMHSRQRYPDE
jgi:toxin ParE1/3/4